MSGDTDKAESIRNEDITTPYNPEDVKIMNIRFV